MLLVSSGYRPGRLLSLLQRRVELRLEGEVGENSGEEVGEDLSQGD